MTRLNSLKLSELVNNVKNMKNNDLRVCWRALFKITIFNFGDYEKIYISTGFKPKKKKFERDKEFLCLFTV